MASSDTIACPCGQLNARQKPLAYADCCGRYVEHFDTTPAPDAQHLMRSRYSAFVRERADYLQATWHPRTRPADLDCDPATRWLGRSVRSPRRTGEATAAGGFVARDRG
ncbi:YchJ family protein, partial [Acidovorax sp.]|uniref:YchJ family protein n=1 Tax=Acidovorax sp. TaxID=1872122 RepID=UPI00391F998F